MMQEQNRWQPPGLYKFSLSQLQLDHHVLAIIGKRGMGKSRLIADILFNHRDVRKVVVFSGSEDGNHFYENLAIPKRFIKTQFDEKYLKDLLNLQTQHMEPLLIIFDDMSFEKKLWKDESIVSILNKGRHYNLGIIFAVQYIIHIPSALRLQVDYAFVFGDNNYKNLNRLHENYFSYVSKLDEFGRIFRHYTKNRGILVSNCTTVDNDVRNCMHWYRATLLEGWFHVGCAEYKSYYRGKYRNQNYRIMLPEQNMKNHKHKV